MKRTIATCSVCKGQYEVYGRVILKQYKCLDCIRKEVAKEAANDAGASSGN